MNKPINLSNELWDNLQYKLNKDIRTNIEGEIGININRLIRSKLWDKLYDKTGRKCYGKMDYQIRKELNEAN